MLLWRIPKPSTAYYRVGAGGFWGGSWSVDKPRSTDRAVVLQSSALGSIQCSRAKEVEHIFQSVTPWNTDAVAISWATTSICWENLVSVIDGWVLQCVGSFLHDFPHNFSVIKYRKYFINIVQHLPTSQNMILDTLALPTNILVWSFKLIWSTAHFYELIRAQTTS